MTDALEIARNMAQSPDNWPPMRVKQVAEALIASERANFALAANQCKAGYAGEHGDHMCHALDALRELLGHCEIAAVMPQATGKAYVMDMESAPLNRARDAIAKAEGAES